MNEQNQNTPDPARQSPAETPTDAESAVAALATPEPRAEQSLADIVPQTQSEPIAENETEELGDDVLVEFSLFVRSREGIIVHIKNCLRLPMAVDPVCLTDAPNQFENALERFLVRPAKMKFNHVFLKAKEAEDKKHQTIGIGSPGAAGNDPAHPLMLASPHPPIEYGNTIAECIANNARLESGN